MKKALPARVPHTQDTGVGRRVVYRSTIVFAVYRPERGTQVPAEGDEARPFPDYDTPVLSASTSRRVGALRCCTRMPRRRSAHTLAARRSRTGGSAP